MTTIAAICEQIATWQRELAGLVADLIDAGRLEDAERVDRLAEEVRALRTQVERDRQAELCPDELEEPF